MTTLISGIKFTAIASDGTPLAGGKVHTYAAGTLTPLATYTDFGGGSANANPVVLDSNGKANIWLGNASYRFIVKDSTDTIVQPDGDVDNIVPSAYYTETLTTAIRTDLAASSGSTLVGFIQTGTSAVARTMQDKARELISSPDFSGRGADNWGYGASAMVAMQPSGAGTGVDNIGIGTSSLNACTVGFGNTGVGKNTLKLLVENAYCTAVGAYALENAKLVGNVNLLCTAVGAYALNENTSGQYNTGVGASAGQFNTTGFFNTYVGKQSGKTNTNGNNNVALGHAALEFNVGSSNVAIGNKAMWNQTTASSNVAIGDSALVNGTGGITQCIAVGLNALSLASTGQHTAVGYRSGESTQTGTGNTYVGWQAGLTVQGGGSNNTFVGHEAGTAETTNGDSVAVGYQALLASVSGQQTAVGSGALKALTNGGGTGSAALGYLAGSSATTGANNVFLGASSGTDAVATVTTASNQIVMGNNAHTNAFIKIAWTVTSDARDKTDFAPLTHGLDFVSKLSPLSFKLMDRETQQATTGKRFGFKAQDVQALEGEDLVLVNADDPDNLKYNETMMIPILVKAIQELRAEVTALRAQIG